MPHTNITREQALALLKKYNQEPFHLLHALTVEAVMRWYAEHLGRAQEADFWAMCGLLHDIDFEQFPQQHCQKAPQLLAEIGAEPELVHAVCSHGYGLVCDVKPEDEMEKAAESLYSKYVPAGVRDFIEMKSGNAPQAPAPRPKKAKPSLPSAVGADTKPEVNSNE